MDESLQRHALYLKSGSRVDTFSVLDRNIQTGYKLQVLCDTCSEFICWALYDMQGTFRTHIGKSPRKINGEGEFCAVCKFGAHKNA